MKTGKNSNFKLGAKCDENFGTWFYLHYKISNDIESRQTKARHCSNLFSVHQGERKYQVYFTSRLKHVVSRSFLSPSINCEKTRSYLGSEQRFIVNWSKVSFQFSYDLK